MNKQITRPKETQTRKVKITLTKSHKGDRYVITDSITGDVIDDAQGYGFTSFDKAVSYAKNQSWEPVNILVTPVTAPLF